MSQKRESCVEKNQKRELDAQKKQKKMRKNE